jgi:hypothetical protein
MLTLSPLLIEKGIVCAELASWFARLFAFSRRVLNILFSEQCFQSPQRAPVGKTHKCLGQAWR